LTREEDASACYFPLLDHLEDDAGGLRGVEVEEVVEVVVFFWRRKRKVERGG
jgi:hypothetical protein